jgi:hypothetical protein
MRIFKTVNHIIEIILRFMTMFLMMTMNGYVIMMIDAGVSNDYCWNVSRISHFSA